LIRSLILESERSHFPQEGEFAILLTLVPTALLSFSCLLANVGLIQDEIEEQTLTYLLLRPVPRWAIYGAKWLAASLVALLIAVVFFALGYLLVFVNSEQWSTAMTTRFPPATLALLLTGFAYCGTFGLLGLLLKRSLALGILYIFLIEGILATIPFNFRMYTVAYHFRMLCFHWLGVGEKEWGLSPIADQTTANTSVMVLLGIAVGTTALSCWISSRREFRMKTPAGN
jgi:ABC-2 type transport system permease protein